MSFLRRVIGRINGTNLPEAFDGTLGETEHVLASAAAAGQRVVVVTSHGLWIPEQAGDRRIGWHRIARIRWSDPELEVVEAAVTETICGIELLEDLPPQRFSLTPAGRVPQLVQTRVERSITERQYRELPGGGAWFVQRREPGVDGVLLQVRPDEGTEHDAVGSLAEGIAHRLHD